NIFLESAYFNPGFVRKSSLHHGLRTDAATHFEKGVDMENVVPALKRAAKLIVEIAGGEITSNITDNYPAPLEETTVTTTYAYINKLSGKNYSKEAVSTILNALGFMLEENDDILTVKVPTNKTDVKQ